MNASLTRNPADRHLAATRSSLVFLTGEELAEILRFKSGVSSAFRGWLKQMGIETVPGRRNTYDAKHVRERLDKAQGINSSAANAAAPPGGPERQETSYVAQRRARLGKG